MACVQEHGSNPQAAALAGAETSSNFTIKNFLTWSTSPPLSSMAGMTQNWPQIGAQTVQPFLYHLCLRKSEDNSIGISLDRHDRMLRVTSVNAGGVAAAWNKLMEADGDPRKIEPGDCIISVNGVVYDPDAMLQEVLHKRLLKLGMLRSGSGYMLAEVQSQPWLDQIETYSCSSQGSVFGTPQSSACAVPSVPQPQEGQDSASLHLMQLLKGYSEPPMALLSAAQSEASQQQVSEEQRTAADRLLKLLAP
eukprot:TRINITY_DN4243_c0_g1_i1.p1 TRINITY_DN4243_c0_g1~~TRINITY_DN4243_c0_g1_i1.p1  ORF type:complete len:250 (-),score=47.09 TRINITY_DN4243_c0_g1_i1:138-887(-)